MRVAAIRQGMTPANAFSRMARGAVMEIDHGLATWGRAARELHAVARGLSEEHFKPLLEVIESRIHTQTVQG